MQPRDFSLYGAVDLGARQAAAQRRQQAAQSGNADTDPGVGNGGVVIDVTEQTFNTDVVERSRTTPVIMDLWAEWCGPCKQLSPVLEKLAVEADGQWILAKVDVDANPQLSAALQVQSIPMVVAVIGGQLVDGFLGALPEAQVRQWISQVMGVAAKMGLSAAGGDGGDGAEDAADDEAARSPAGVGPQAAAGGLPPAYAEARDAMERGDFDAAARVFEAELARAPADPVAKTGLAQVNLIRRVNSYDEAKVRRDAAEHPSDPEAQSRVADIDMASGRIDEAFDRLLGVVRRTSGEDREKARAHLVGLFDIYPPRDPRVSKARAALSALLF
ncbi:MAG: tetratricopeptide repeat protein [Streptosporangiaceae bacterium]|nr:tetratricopeptide repeat protein [Streptosporangiaceae bacterium]